MKKFFAVAAAMLLSVASFAQTEAGKFFVMPKVGVNMATITDTDNSKMRVGFAVGLGAGYQLSDNAAITADFLYSQQGVKGDGRVSDGGLNIKGDLTCKYDYINIPILANYYVAPGLAIKAGVQPSFLVSAKDKLEISASYGGESGSGSRDVDVKDALNSFELSIPVGISYEFSNIVIDARYNLGVTKVFKSDTDVKGKNSVIQITLGYKFDI